MKLQSDLVFKMASKIGTVSEKEIEEELKLKKQITLANHAVDEVKIFVRAQLHFITLMYKDQFPVSNDQYVGDLLSSEELRTAINEDVLRVIIAAMFSGSELYKILILLFRVDNFDQDKDLRAKYSCMKGVKTTDFSIDPYLSLADPLIVLKEASLRYGIDIKTQNMLLQNPSVQKMDLEDIVNIEFKEYFKNNHEDFKQLPDELRVKLLAKARIRPYQKSVIKFREIMTQPASPIDKLLNLQSLKV